jgi:hypothetical protein
VVQFLQRGLKLGHDFRNESLKRPGCIWFFKVEKSSQFGLVSSYVVQVRVRVSYLIRCGYGDM